MALKIVRNDITNMAVDAIVNAANKTLLGGGGVDGAIHKAAGPKLLEECKTLRGAETGQAKITKGHNLKANHVIHTVGPIYGACGGKEEALLQACYRNSLNLAKDHKLKTVAFPLISAGAYGYPKDQALKVAMSTISEFLMDNEMDVYIVVFDKKSFGFSSKIAANIKQYIDDNYVEAKTAHFSYASRRDIFEECKELNQMAMPLSDIAFDQLEDTFSERLIRLIDKAGKSDVEIYKKANIDRKLFSKIRSNKDYHPKKETAISFVFALELSLDEAKDLLLTAGYAISNSSKFDLIIKYHLENKIYDINEINAALFEFDEQVL